MYVTIITKAISLHSNLGLEGPLLLLMNFDDIFIFKFLSRVKKSLHEAVNCSINALHLLNQQALGIFPFHITKLGFGRLHFE